MEARERLAATFPYPDAESALCGLLVAFLPVRVPDALPWRLSPRERKEGFPCLVRASRSRALKLRLVQLAGNAECLQKVS